MKLRPDDRIRIARWLSELREFEPEQNRRRLLELAGLEALAPQIDVSGSPLMAAASVIDFLVRYGRLASGVEALGPLLNLCGSLVAPERQREIAEILRRYAMMTPVAAAPGLDMRAGLLPATMINEKIIGQNTLRTIAFLARGLRASRAVGLVKVDSTDESWTGSGFLVGPDLFLTNFHVVSSPDQALNATVTFDFEEDEFGRERQTTEVGVLELIAFNKTLDYSLLRIVTAVGKTHGWLPLQPKTVRVGDRVNIIQHPGGQLKQVSLQANFVEYVDGAVIQYVTSTLPGSSGAPVMDDNWDLVALHHAGGMLSEPTTGNTYYRNEGISIGAIRHDLPPRLLELLAAQDGRFP